MGSRAALTLHSSIATCQHWHRQPKKSNQYPVNLPYNLFLIKICFLLFISCWSPLKICREAYLKSEVLHLRSTISSPMPEKSWRVGIVPIKVNRNFFPTSLIINSGTHTLLHGERKFMYQTLAMLEMSHDEDDDYSLIN